MNINTCFMSITYTQKKGRKYTVNYLFPYKNLYRYEVYEFPVNNLKNHIAIMRQIKEKILEYLPKVLIIEEKTGNSLINYDTTITLLEYELSQTDYNDRILKKENHYLKLPRTTIWGAMNFKGPYGHKQLQDLAKERYGIDVEDVLGFWFCLLGFHCYIPNIALFKNKINHLLIMKKGEIYKYAKNIKNIPKFRSNEIKIDIF
jgi:hypothetical protein